MKQTFFICFGIFLIGFSGFSQAGKQGVRSEVLNPEHAGKIFRNPVYKKDKPLGSPYLMTAFAAANVEDLNIKAYMRYNTFKDEFEFITPKNDTLILDKIEDFAKINFTGLNKKYRLVVYTGSRNSLTNGYLIELYNKNDYTLFKKENIIFMEEKPAKTTLEVRMPAKYTKTGDTFFIKMPNGNTTEFPDGKKALIKMFPDKKQVVETYFKENKIDFDNEGDLIKIIGLL